MHRRKGLLILLVALLGVATMFLGLAMWPAPRSRVNPENLQRINPDMTEQEVVAILGEPSQRNPGALGFEGDEWVADVYFDDQGRVTATSYGPQASLWTRIRRRILP